MGNTLGTYWWRHITIAPWCITNSNFSFQSYLVLVLSGSWRHMLTSFQFLFKEFSSQESTSIMGFRGDYNKCTYICGGTSGHTGVLGILFLLSSVLKHDDETY